MTRFIREKIDDTPIKDSVFAVVDKANKAIAEVGKENVINATIGALYDEDENLVTFQSVFSPYNKLPNTSKAKYASSFSGNPEYRKQVYEWVKQDANITLKHRVIATPGGSGAVSTAMIDILDAQETVVLPEIAWSSYQLMASMDNFEVETYRLFEEDHFDLKNFKEVCLRVMKKQKKLLVILNDPCHNPTGYSLSKEEWDGVVNILNECGEQGPVVLVNDIAYIDFAYDFNNSRKYMETWNNISNNVMIIVAFSLSKSLTSYGMRCGAAIILAQEEESVQQVEIVMEKSARAIWSNIPNAPMENFVYVTTEGLDAYTKEKDFYVSLLQKRSNIFIDEAKEVGLKHYPYKEGFFVTLAIPDADVKEKFHQACMDEHIYTVQVTKGIRVGICSLNIAKTTGLAKKMKNILNRVEG